MNIKKLFNILIPLAALALVSCAKTEPTVFQASAPSFAAGALVKTVTVKVTCDYKWDARLENSSWGSVNVNATEEGGTVDVVLGINTLPSERTNKLILTSGSQVIEKEITQQGYAQLFGKEEIVLVSTVRQSLVFTTPVKWTVRIAEGADWITPLDQDYGSSGSVNLRLSAKSEFIDVGERTGAIEFTFDNDGTIRIPIRQRQKDTIEASENEISLPSFEAGVISLESRYNIDYTVQCSSWIHPEEGTKALSVDQLRFTVDENEDSHDRTGYISLRAADGHMLSADVTVKQPGRDPIIDEKLFGAYYIDGDNFIYTKNGITQLSRMYDPSKGFSMRMFSPADAIVAEISGLVLPAATGDAARIKLQVFERDITAFSRSWDAKVIYTRGDTVWLQTQDGKSYFIVKQ